MTAPEIDEQIGACEASANGFPATTLRHDHVLAMRAAIATLRRVKAGELVPRDEHHFHRHIARQLTMPVKCGTCGQVIEP